eukprot:5541544-Prymnesium_polylepis.1
MHSYDQPDSVRQSETAISLSTWSLWLRITRKPYWSHGHLDFTSSHSRSMHIEHAGATGGGGGGGCSVDAATRRAGVHLLGGACFYDLDQAWPPDHVRHQVRHQTRSASQQQAPHTPHTRAWRCRERRRRRSGSPGAP